MYTNNLIEDCTVTRCAEELARTTNMPANMISQITTVSVEFAKKKICEFRK